MDSQRILIDCLIRSLRLMLRDWKVEVYEDDLDLTIGTVAELIKTLEAIKGTPSNRP